MFAHNELLLGEVVSRLAYGQEVAIYLPMVAVDDVLIPSDEAFTCVYKGVAGDLLSNPRHKCIVAIHDVKVRIDKLCVDRFEFVAEDVPQVRFYLKNYGVSCQTFLLATTLENEQETEKYYSALDKNRIKIPF